MPLYTRLAVLLLASLTAVSAHAQSSGIELVGQLNPRGGPYSDVWGYVGPGGTEYALLANWIDGGLSIIDVSNATPVEVGFVPMNGNGSDVEYYDHYVYLTSDNDPTLIIDIADPANPVALGTFGPGRHTLSVAGDRLYTNGSGGVRIYSLTDPTNPTLLGAYDPFYIHDILVRNDTMYTAGIYGDGIDIVDVSNPSSPALIERFNYPGSGAHNACSDPSGSYLYVGDEIGTGRWTRIFDVRDPLNVEFVGEIIIDAGSTVHNCHTKDNLLYIAHYDRGVWVYDIADPANPVEVGYYETGVSNFGIWTVNPNLPSGKILASDGNNGLLVLKLTSPVANEANPETPADFALEAAYPNPFNPSTTLRFTLGDAAEVRLAVLDGLGREVAVVAQGRYAAGTHSASFQAGDLPSGLYLVRLDANGRTDTQRITLLK